MQYKLKILVILIVCIACNKSAMPDNFAEFQITKNIVYNGVSVNIIIYKPIGNEFDVLVVFHGTVRKDNLVLQAAQNILDEFKAILQRKDIMIISVAYPEENLLFGDNIAHSEAALLWVINNMTAEMGIKSKKIFLAGHSQGGYIVTRLNTMHKTDGVIANAPGPLNLVFRCHLEESGQIEKAMECTKLFDEYGSVSDNPEQYQARSLLNFTGGYKADILFVQGMQDGPIQMYSWPTFKQQVQVAGNNKNVQFLELPNHGHNALFSSPTAIDGFNDFIKTR